MVGNAVPVRLAYHLAMAIKQQLLEKSFAETFTDYKQASLI
jgi:hypothetical protein